MNRWIDKLIDQCIKFLGNRWAFVAALIVPLAVIPMPQGVQRIENILSSNWIQLWALFAMTVVASRAYHHAKAAHEHVKKHLGYEDGK